VQSLNFAIFCDNEAAYSNQFQKSDCKNCRKKYQVYISSRNLFPSPFRFARSTTMMRCLIKLQFPVPYIINNMLKTELVATKPSINFDSALMEGNVFNLIDSIRYGTAKSDYLRKNKTPYCPPQWCYKQWYQFQIIFLYSTDMIAVMENNLLSVRICDSKSQLVRDSSFACLFVQGFLMREIFDYITKACKCVLPNCICSVVLEYTIHDWNDVHDILGAE
jgi:hypothetical protein